jgi:hypothetical protein
MARFVGISPAGAKLNVSMWASYYGETAKIDEAKTEARLDLSGVPVGRTIAGFVVISNPNPFPVGFNYCFVTDPIGREWTYGSDTCEANGLASNELGQGLRFWWALDVEQPIPPPPSGPTPPSPGQSKIYGHIVDALTEEPLDGHLVVTGPSAFTLNSTDGEFESDDIFPGEYHVEVTVDGYTTQSKDVTATADDSIEVVLRMVKPALPGKGKIIGKVSDKKDGGPFVDATITVGGEQYRTGEDGTYSTGDLEAGKYTVRAEYPGYYSQEIEAVVVANQTLSVDFALDVRVSPGEIDCSKPPEVTPLFQPMINAVWALFCPVIKEALQSLQTFNLKKALDDFGDSLVARLLPPWLKDAISTAKKGMDFAFPIMGKLIQQRHSEADPGTINYNDEPGVQYQPRPQENSGVGLFGGIAREMWRAVLGDFDQQAPGLVKAAQASLSPHSPEWKTDLEAALTTFKGSVFDSVMDPIKKIEATHSPITVEAALASANLVTLGGLAAVLAAFIADTSGEVATLGQVEAIGKGARDILRYTGIRGLSSNILTAPVRHGVLPWLGRHYDQLFRTHIFERDLADTLFIRGEIKKEDWSQIYKWYGFPDGDIEHIANELRALPPGRLLDQMLFHKEITQEEWNQVYSKAGWRDTYRDKWQKALWTNPSDRLISTMLEIAQEERPWFTEKLTNRGYTSEDAEKLISIFNRLTTKDELKTLMSDLVTEYAQGLSSESELSSALEKLNRPKEEISIRMDLAKVKADRAKKTADRKLLREKYVKLQISESVYRAGLTGLGLEADRLETEVGLAKLDRKDQVEKALTKSEQELLFRFEIIDEAALRERLKTFGYEDSEVEDLVAIAKKRKPPPKPDGEAALTKADIKALYTAGLRDEAWVDLQLQEKGYDAEDSRDLLEYWSTKLPQEKPPPEAALTKSDVEALFVAGKRDQAWMTRQLKAKGYDDADIADLLELWTSRIPRVPPAPYEALTKAELEALFLAGLKDRDFTTTQLRTRGLTEIEISDLLLLWESKLPVSKPPAEAALTKSEVLDLWSIAELSDVEAKNRLKDLGFDLTAIDLLESLKNYRTLSSERTTMKTQLLADYVEGIGSNEELQELLGFLAYTDPEVALYLAQGQTRYHRELTKKYVAVYIRAAEDERMTLEQFSKALDTLPLRDDYKKDLVAYVSVYLKPAEEFGG